MANTPIGTKGVCSICGVKPFTVTCSCGSKFDYHCINQHVNDISMGIEDHHRQVTNKLNRIHEMQAIDNDDLDAPAALINNWVCIHCLAFVFLELII